MKKKFHISLLSSVLVFVVVLLMSRCSAPWHLSRALKKDPSIIDVKKDSSTNISVSYQVQTISIHKKTRLKLVTDTAFEEVPVDKEINLDTLRVYNQDSSVVAESWVNNGKRGLRGWAIIDTTISWEDSVQVKNKIIEKKTRVIEEREATIKKKKGILGQLRDIISVLIVAGVVVTFVYLLDKLGLFKKT